MRKSGAVASSGTVIAGLKLECAAPAFTRPVTFVKARCCRAEAPERLMWTGSFTGKLPEEGDRDISDTAKQVLPRSPAAALSLSH